MPDAADRDANTGDRGSNSHASGKKVTPKKKTTVKDPEAKKQLVQKEKENKTERNKKDTAVRKRTKRRRKERKIVVKKYFFADKITTIAGDSQNNTAQNLLNKGSKMKIRAEKTKTNVSQRYKTQFDMDSTASSDNLETESSEGDSETGHSDASEPETEDHTRPNPLPEDDEVQNPSNLVHESANPVAPESAYQGAEMDDTPSTTSVVKNDSDSNTKSGGAVPEKENKGVAKQEGCQKGPKEKIPKIQISTVNDFEEYAKQGEVKRRFHQSTKPHLLLVTAEIEAYRGNWEQAEKALQNALNYFQKHSQPTADELLKFAKQCESEVLLRAALLYRLSAEKRKAEGKKYSHPISQTIYQVGRLLCSMLNTPPRPEMRNGIHYKEVAAKFCAPLMVQMYNSGCSTPNNKIYALSWIAVAHCDIENYEEAAKYGELGLKILRRQFPFEEDRKKRRDYASLLQSVGLAYENLDAHSDNEALKYLEEAVLATESSDYGKDEDDREKALSIRKGFVERLKKTIADNTNSD